MVFRFFFSSPILEYKDPLQATREMFSCPRGLTAPTILLSLYSASVNINNNNQFHCSYLHHSPCFIFQMTELLSQSGQSSPQEHNQMNPNERKLYFKNWITDLYEGRPMLYVPYRIRSSLPARQREIPA